MAFAWPIVIFAVSIIHSRSEMYNGWGWDYQSSAKTIMDDACEITLTAANTTKYNLCPLQLLPQSQIEYYNVHDIRLNKSFAFNILSPTLNIPSSKCPQSDTNSYAYLYDTNECIPLSSESAVVSLLNDHNPSEGILISYTSTETSTICGDHGKRLNLRFVCDNEAIVDIPNTIVSEIDYYGTNPNDVYNQCQYNLTFNSVYGCPHSCPIYNKKVCNGYGLCGYDATIKHGPRCYCYSTIGGIACEIDPEDKNVFVPSSEPWPYKDAYNLSLVTVHQFTWNKTAYDGKVHSMNVTYDLSPFENIKKVKDLDGTQYDYYIGSVPAEYQTMCANKTSKGVIFQIDADNNECVVAGGWDISWDLYDSSNPVKGASVSFKSGDVCDKNGDERQFKINFICPDDGNTYFVPNESISAFVEEDDWNSCDYHMDIVSAYVCPKECQTNDNDEDDGVSVCNKNGMCIGDIFSGYVHCACEGPPHLVWDDDYCSSHQPDNGPPHKLEDGKMGDDVRDDIIVALAIVTGFAIVFCIAFACLFFQQKKKIDAVNDVNYQKPMLEQAIAVPNVEEH